MTGDELAKLLEEGRVSLLDVRTDEEWSGEAGYACDPRQGHIEGAVHVPLAELAGEGDVRELVASRGLDLSRPVVAYCHSGQRSEGAAALLRAAGVDAVNYEGSWHEWSRRGEGLDRDEVSE